MSKGPLPKLQKEVAGSLEFNLLLLCARSRVDIDTAREILKILESGIEWEILLAMTRWHGAAPLVYQSLLQVPCKVPPHLLEALRKDYYENEIRIQSHTEELASVVAKLDAAGVSCIPFKGPGLGHLAFRTPTLRLSTNLDILVRRQDMHTASTLLLSQGYQSISASDVMPEDALLHLESKIGFRHPITGIHLELHCQIVPRRYGYLVSFDQLWERSQTVTTAVGEVPALSREDYLVVLCLHAIKHGFWPGLKLVVDLAELIDSSPAIDWKLLKSEALKLRALRPVFLGLWLAHDLLGAKLPANLLLEIERDPVIRPLAARVRKRLFNRIRGFDNLVQATRVHLSLKAGLLAKARYLICITTTPSERDFIFRGSPVTLSQSYFIRMLKFANKFAGQVTKGLLPRRRANSS